MITYLKIIVIVLGVMIAAGLVVIGIKLVEKSDELGQLDSGAGETGEADAGTAPEAVAPPARGDLGLPAGSEVRRMTAAEQRLILVVAVPDAGERIVIIDLRDGRTIATIGIEGAGIEGAGIEGAP